jgi:hypothetical protein
LRYVVGLLMIGVWIDAAFRRCSRIVSISFNLLRLILKNLLTSIEKF